MTEAEKAEILAELRHANNVLRDNPVPTETDKFLDTAFTYTAYAAVGVLGAVVTALYYRSLE